MITRNILGAFCIVVLEVCKKLPRNLLYIIGLCLLPLYFLFRLSHPLHLKNLWTHTPYSKNLHLFSYYKIRLDILIWTIKQHGKPLPRSFVSSVELKGSDILLNAQQEKRPLLLLGLHMGYFELLHQIPGLILNPPIPIHIVVAPTFSPLFTRYLNRGRMLKQNQLILNHDIIKTLSKKTESSDTNKSKHQDLVLASMADQSPAEKPERILLWNKIEVPISLGLLKWIHKYQGLVIPVSTSIGHEGEIEFYIHPLLKQNQEETDNVNFDAAFWKLSIQKFLEGEISKYPEQWNWSYPGLRVRH